MPCRIKVPSVGESVTEGILSRWPEKGRRRRSRRRTGRRTGNGQSHARGCGPGRRPIADCRCRRDHGSSRRCDRSHRGSTPAGRPSNPPRRRLNQWPPLSEPRLCRHPRVHAEARGIDPGQLTGSGRGGRITKRDRLGASADDGNGSASGGSQPPGLNQISQQNQISQENQGVNTPRSPRRETRQRMTSSANGLPPGWLMHSERPLRLTTFNEVICPPLLRSGAV